MAGYCSTESELIRTAVELGAEAIPVLDQQEKRLIKSTKLIQSSLFMSPGKLASYEEDLLGNTLCDLRTPSFRRELGAVYTPPTIVQVMLEWAARFGEPERIIDPGVGSGRFLVEAGKLFKSAELIGVDIDPMATLVARANLACSGFASRSRILLSDYRDVDLKNGGRTLFIGNPPYVRHHLIDSKWKKWLTAEALKLGIQASALAGLHAYFFLATVKHAKPGDYGVFIASAEWLDVNYGSVIRRLLLDHLGGRSILLIDPKVEPFPGTATTGAIVTFHLASRPASFWVRKASAIEDLAPLEAGRRIRRERLENEKRWSHFLRTPSEKREGFVELGEICRVHRGQVTGSNKVWIEGPLSAGLPEKVLYHSVTKARDIIDAGGELTNSLLLKRVVDLPEELDMFDPIERDAIESFLAKAKKLGADETYVARNRRKWWSVSLRNPAPILATYMARRAPVFVLNRIGARHINIAHGLYPREPMGEATQKLLVDYLTSHASTLDGRTYAGGLVKFEPREMERILVPRLGAASQ